MPSQAINSFSFPPHTLWKSHLTSPHTHTLNTHDWWQLLNHRAIHMHEHITSAQYTCTEAPPTTSHLPASKGQSPCPHPHPLTLLLMNQSAGSIHFIAVKPHRSAPFLRRPNTAAGGLKDREEKEGVWNILAVQRLLISHPLWSPRNVVFWWCVAVCASVKWKREEGLKKDQEGTMSSPRVYTRYLTFLLPLRDWRVSTVPSITVGRM